MPITHSKIWTFIAAVFVVFGCVTAIDTDGSEAGSSFSVTDSTGKQFDYDAPSEHIIVTGYAATLTIIDAGMASKIYATDNYGAEAFDERKVARPTVWQSNYNDSQILFHNIVDAVQNGKFDVYRDTLILTSWKTLYVGQDLNGGLRGELMDPVKMNGKPLKLVPFFGTISEYDEMVSVIDHIEKIVGSSAGLASKMVEKKNKVVEAVSGLEKTPALFVRYSPSKGWGIGVSGSIGGTLIETAGGSNIGKSAGSSTVYDEGKMIELLSSSPNAVIFLDNRYFVDGGTFEKFVDDVMGGEQGGHGLVRMQKTWNNYDPESADGLIEIAHVLHPEAVEGTVEPYFAEGSGGGNIVLYAGIGVAVTVAAVAGFLLFRAKH